MAGTLITDRHGAQATYKILRRLGKGGMAEVFLARQEGMAGFRRLAVIKKILPKFSSSTSVVEMLLDEARIAGQLSHPNIVQVYDVGQEGGQYFISMEYVDGCDLATLARIERRRKRRVSMRLTLRVITEAALGLDYAHRQTSIEGQPLNIVHRDISPHNIMCSREGAVKVTDFGIAKAVGKVQVTEVGVVKGKIHYMAPEQYTGAHVDRRSDVYSLGVVLYQLTTGRLPRVSKDGNAARRLLDNKIPLPSQIRSDYPKELEAILMRALQMSPDKRYQTAGAMRDELIEFGQRHDLFASPKELGSYVDELAPPIPIEDPSASVPAAGRKSDKENFKTAMPRGTERVTSPGKRPSDRVALPASSRDPSSSKGPSVQSRFPAEEKSAPIVVHEPGPASHAPLELAPDDMDNGALPLVPRARVSGRGGDHRTHLTEEHGARDKRSRRRRSDSRPHRVTPSYSKSRIAKDDRLEPSQDVGRGGSWSSESPSSERRDGSQDRARGGSDRSSAVDRRRRWEREDSAQDSSARRSQKLHGPTRGDLLHPSTGASGARRTRSAKPSTTAIRKPNWGVWLGLPTLVVVVAGLLGVLYALRGRSTTANNRPDSGIGLGRAGTIDVVATPEEARVSIDGAQRCASTPCRIAGLPLGTGLVVTVHAKDDAYDVWRQMVVLVPEEPKLLLRATLRPRLDRGGGSASGTPTTTSTTKRPISRGRRPGRLSHTEGKPTPKKPQTNDDAADLSKADSGVAKTMASDAGARATSNPPKVLLNKDGVRIELVDYRLPRAVLTVDIRPGWAIVSIDGKDIAETPMQRIINEGDRKVRLRNPKLGLDRTFQVKAVKGKNIKITVRTSTSSAPTK